MALGRPGRALEASLLALALALPAAATGPVAAGPVLRFAVVDGLAVAELSGVAAEALARLPSAEHDPAAWADRFAVFTEEASLAEGRLPPLLGSYRIEPWGVRFTSRFTPAAGQTYVARYRDPLSDLEVRASLSIPFPDAPPSTELAAIFPSASELPENLLRIYLQFSAPMSRGNARHHIRLLDERGVAVAGAFVASERELWSPDGTRLTLFFDPGRIKRGVGPNVEVGPPLAAGRSYRLVVERELLDARGVPLVDDYAKEFRVRAADRAQPRTDEWRLHPPAGPDDAVRLSFPEPLDHGLLVGLIEVLDGAGRPVPGRVEVAAGETSWSFRPELDWRREVYRIRVDTLLEDLAGNSLRRPFETALDGGNGGAPPYLDLPFALAGGG